MYVKYLCLAAIAGAASAQTLQGLNATLTDNNMTSLLASYLTLSGLEKQLEGMKNITILAPSNEALGTLLNSSAGASLSSNKAAIMGLLQYHVLNGSYPASMFTNTSSEIHTELNSTAFTNVTGGQVVEGVVIGNQTMFYSGLLANATVIQADVSYANGIIHVIDTVLTIPENITATALALNLTAAYGALNMTNSGVADDILKDVTAFVPNNDAFQAIGSALANLSISELQTILAYHVVQGQVEYSSMLTNGTKLKTEGGGSITITIQNNTIFVDSAKVVTPDVLVANGVIHVIDNVLNPNSTSATPAPTATSGAPAYSGASSASNVPFTSGQPTPTTTIASSAASSAASSSTKKGAAAPMRTGAMNAAALFGAGAALMNL